MGRGRALTVEVDRPELGTESCDVFYRHVDLLDDASGPRVRELDALSARSLMVESFAPELLPEKRPSCHVDVDCWEIFTERLRQGRRSSTESSLGIQTIYAYFV